jgi:hypothetical protein
VERAASDAVPLEVESDRDARALAIVERLDGALGDRGEPAAGAAHRPARGGSSSMISSVLVSVRGPALRVTAAREPMSMVWAIVVIVSTGCGV